MKTAQSLWWGARVAGAIESVDYVEEEMTERSERAGTAKDVVLKSQSDWTRNAGQLLNSKLVDQLQVTFGQKIEVWGSLRQAFHACLEQEKRMEPLWVLYTFTLHRMRAILRESIHWRMNTKM